MGIVSKFILLLLLVTNGFAGLYLSHFHQAAPIQIMQYLHDDIVAKMGNNETLKFKDMDVHFVTSCHATPFYSHLHLGDATNFVPLRFLECSPHFDDEGNLTREKTPSWYLEVAPTDYFKDVLSKSYANESCPRYFIIASHHLMDAAIVIEQCGYNKQARFLDNYFDDAYLIVLSL